MAAEDGFIGQGWAFPPAFDRPAPGSAPGSALGAAPGVAMVTGPQDIEQSLRILFTTARGERFLRLDYGASLAAQMFEPMTTARLAWIEETVRTAILLHEPRIDADRVTVTNDPAGGCVTVEIGYRLRGANSRYNVVFPWYLRDGAPAAGGQDGG
jgi:hypothetical protein